MKKKMITAGFIAASIVMVMFLSTAVAFSSVYITISGKGRIWQFAPQEDKGEVTDVSAYYILNSVPGIENSIPIKQKVITNNVITLVFEHSELPDLDPDTFTTGVHVTADTNYNVAGPGFAWGRTR
jgi:hypothetical protein